MIQFVLPNFGYCVRLVDLGKEADLTVHTWVDLAESKNVFHAWQESHPYNRVFRLGATTLALWNSAKQVVLLWTMPNTIYPHEYVAFLHLYYSGKQDEALALHRLIDGPTVDLALQRFSRLTKHAVPEHSVPRWSDALDTALQLGSLFWWKNRLVKALPKRFRRHDYLTFFNAPTQAVPIYPNWGMHVRTGLIPVYLRNGNLFANRRLPKGTVIESIHNHAPPVAMMDRQTHLIYMVHPWKKLLETKDKSKANCRYVKNPKGKLSIFVARDVPVDTALVVLH